MAIIIVSAYHGLIEIRSSSSKPLFQILQILQILKWKWINGVIPPKWLSIANLTHCLIFKATTIPTTLFHQNKLQARGKHPAMCSLTVIAQILVLSLKVCKTAKIYVWRRQAAQLWTTTKPPQVVWWGDAVCLLYLQPMIMTILTVSGFQTSEVAYVWIHMFVVSY